MPESFWKILLVEIMKSQTEKWNRRVPNNPEDPFDKFLEILSMGSIASRKHDLEIIPRILESWNLGILELRNLKL